MLILNVSRSNPLTYIRTNPTTAGRTCAPETLQPGHHILPLGWTELLSPQLVYSLPSATRRHPRSKSIQVQAPPLSALPRCHYPPGLCQDRTRRAGRTPLIQLTQKTPGGKKGGRKIIFFQDWGNCVRQFWSKCHDVPAHHILYFNPVQVEGEPKYSDCKPLGKCVGKEEGLNFLSFPSSRQTFTTLLDKAWHCAIHKRNKLSDFAWWELYESRGQKPYYLQFLVVPLLQHLEQIFTCPLKDPFPLIFSVFNLLWLPWWCSW